MAFNQPFAGAGGFDLPQAAKGFISSCPMCMAEPEHIRRLDPKPVLPKINGQFNDWAVFIPTYETFCKSLCLLHRAYSTSALLHAFETEKAKKRDIIESYKEKRRREEQALGPQGPFGRIPPMKREAQRKVQECEKGRPMPAYKGPPVSNLQPKQRAGQIQPPDYPNKRVIPSQAEVPKVTSDIQSMSLQDLQSALNSGIASKFFGNCNTKRHSLQSTEFPQSRPSSNSSSPSYTKASPSPSLSSGSSSYGSASPSISSGSSNYGSSSPSLSSGSSSYGSASPSISRGSSNHHHSSSLSYSRTTIRYCESTPSSKTTIVIREYNSPPPSRYHGSRRR